MANVVKKHSISSELAQKMVDEAVAKARELGVSENVAFSMTGDLKAFSRMMGPDPFHRDGAEQGVYSSVRRPHPGLFQLYPTRPRRFWPASPRLRVWRRGEEGFP